MTCAFDLGKYSFKIFANFRLFKNCLYFFRDGQYKDVLGFISLACITNPILTIARYIRFIQFNIILVLIYFNNNL